jgi:hypothetical protein
MMIVFLNDKEITVFKGATLGELVLFYSKTSFRKLKSGYLGIYDRFGYLTEPDGPAFEGQRYYLRIIKK